MTDKVEAHQKTRSRSRRWIILIMVAVLFLATAIYQLFFAPHLIVVWLQNSDEIRATGGFLGSVGWLEMRGLRPTDARLRDIYELGGHLPEYVEPPAPIKKYLAAGGSWRLQDANWQRDFAQSATQFSDFLVLMGQRCPDLVVAVNLSLIEQIFDYLGGVEIVAPDGTVTMLTGDNFAQIARARRPRQNQYDFPKMDLLRGAAAGARAKISALSNEKKMELARWLIWQARQNRQVQFFSPHRLWQRFFAAQKIAGLLTDQDTVNEIYLVDSNVGVNKVNRYITRAQDWQINTASSSAALTLTWHNTCQPNFADELTPAACTYANYFRVLLDPKITPLFSTQTLDVNTVVDSQNQTWQEIGWLIMVPPSSTVSAILNFTAENFAKLPTWEIY